MDFDPGLPRIHFPSSMIHQGLGQSSSHLLPSEKMEKPLPIPYQRNIGPPSIL